MTRRVAVYPGEELTVPRQKSKLVLLTWDDDHVVLMDAEGFQHAYAQGDIILTEAEAIEVVGVVVPRQPIWERIYWAIRRW